MRYKPSSAGPYFPPDWMLRLCTPKQQDELAPYMPADSLLQSLWWIDILLPRIGLERFLEATRAKLEDFRTDPVLVRLAEKIVRRIHRRQNPQNRKRKGMV